jgi:hypothetical protein
VLRGAGLLDEAHAAVHLHAERGDLDADLGEKPLATGVSSRRTPGLLARTFGVGMVVRASIAAAVA